MIETTNFPLSTYTLQQYGSWKEVRKKVKECGLNGLEVIADPDNLADDIPRSLVKGYHMQFYPDWLDFYRQNKEALIRKFGSLDFAESFYRELTKAGFNSGHVTIAAAHLLDCIVRKGASLPTTDLN